MLIFCNIAVFRSKAIFSNICMPCDIKHRLQTKGNDPFLVLLIVRRDLFRRGILDFLRRGEGGHIRSLYEAEMKFCLLLGGILAFLSREEAGHIYKVRILEGILERILGWILSRILGGI